jgi:hypothetical protein
MSIERRHFLSRFSASAGVAAGAAAVPGMAAPAAVASGPNASGLGNLFLARQGRRKRSSSWDRTGKNADRMTVEPGASATIAEIEGAGCVRHIWVTINDDEPDYLRRLVLRAWWDGEQNPSVETPIGDFFGVGHGRVTNYWSQPLNMVTGGGAASGNRAAMNCFFPMPFAKGARLTVENQGEQRVGALYFYVDYEAYDSLPDDALRFHAQFRREYPTKGTLDLSDANNFQRTNEVVNLDGRENYVIMEAEGRGHYVGCNLSIDQLNPIKNFSWFGEGDDMMYIDGEKMPSIVGTGTEDYFCAAWGYPGGHNSMPYHGISLAGPMHPPDEYSGKWTMYRYHVQDPVMFEKSIKVTIEHGHGNVHANDYSSVGYWYQTEPHQKFPALPGVEKRLPVPERDSLREYWKTF